LLKLQNSWTQSDIGLEHDFQHECEHKGNHLILISLVLHFTIVEGTSTLNRLWFSKCQIQCRSRWKH